MKFIYQITIAFTLSILATSALAKDKIGNFSIVDAMASEEAKAILGDKIKFYFGDQPHPTVAKSFVEHSSHRKTNGSNKSNQTACNWVFLSNLKELKESVEQYGGNAVINIRSNYRNNPTTSMETFKCASGFLMSDVALVGEVVLLAE
jgi:uncharacterized protein YbjQ (UPF0145 family)